MAATADTPLTVAERIRLERYRRDMTQSELAVLLGVDQMTVSRWERGTHLPKAQKRKALAAVLGGDPTDYRKDITE